MKNFDPKVIPLVEFFNQRGLKTHMSMFWISFDESVAEEDLKNWISSESNI